MKSSNLSNVVESSCKKALRSRMDTRQFRDADSRSLFEKAFEEGFREAFSEGVRKGFREGMQAVQFQVTGKLGEKGMPVEEILSIVQLPEEEEGFSSGE